MSIFVDFINAQFILLACIFGVYNIYIIYKHKDAKGISISSQLFFFVWTVWSLFFYVSLGQWVSCVLEFVLMLTTLTYLCLMVYYIHRNKSIRGVS